MRASIWRRGAAVIIVWLGICGCGGPTGNSTPSLTVAAAKNTLDTWNPGYSKVVDFYGFVQAGQNDGNTRLAYVLLANPGAANQKPQVYTARFVLLTRPDGQHQWYLASLVTPGEGLSRRQGWDNLLIPVKAPAASEGQ